MLNVQPCPHFNDEDISKYIGKQVSLKCSVLLAFLSLTQSLSVVV